ncbi:FAD-dependent oxidoreductase [Chlorobaculum thiosulfatiphilum]|uniref:FAD-dependent oxidoreductase n=1 Tax=Chlorobaculum thiosulfatiphilum TaxID=115852 RepID=A0A5C4S4M8_CHLTI|nr:FAD-dependent oxidoreductase [Chlorobaculum thiosulfatiphilum]TNJ38420.1 FAD-dependent oxidoreductase [Chlorobaculum thiosulfatiphilum]
MAETVDVIVVGAGIGGLTAAALLQERGFSTIVFEKNRFPGGSCSSFRKGGYTFDAGASVFYGFRDDDAKGTLNLHSRIFRKLGVEIETIADPVQIHYHLPAGFEVPAWFDRDRFLESLSRRFPHERTGIRKFYDELESVYAILNALPAGSLEDVMHLGIVGARHPLKTAALGVKTLFSMGKTARRYISDPELLHFIDLESYSWSVQDAISTPLVNAGICLADRHHGGINYPVGGSGAIPAALVKGFEKFGGSVRFGSEVAKVIVEKGAASGVRLSDGTEVRARAVVSNATAWDTFSKLVDDPRLRIPDERFIKAPSWFQVWLGVDGAIVPPGFHMHHIIVGDWSKYDQLGGTIYFSAPSVLDPSLAPPGKHALHLFVTAETWQWEQFDYRGAEYKAAKEAFARSLIARAESLLPGLREAVELTVTATPQSHVRYLNRRDGSYGPLLKPGQNILLKPQNRTPVKNLYAAGDSTFPGQGVIAVTYSGVSCASYIARQLGKPLDYL